MISIENYQTQQLNMLSMSQELGIDMGVLGPSPIDIVKHSELRGRLVSLNLKAKEKLATFEILKVKSLNQTSRFCHC